MKKLLLFACMAVMAISANAQKLATFKGEPVKVDLNCVKMIDKEVKKTTSSTLNADAVKAGKSMSLKKASGIKKAAAFPTSDEINGPYIEDSFDDMHYCGEVEISDTLVTFPVDEEGNTIECNKFITMDKGYVEVFGIYDEKTGALTIPGAQYCYEHEKYGMFALFAIVDEKTSMDDLTFTYDDVTNSFYLDQEGYFVYMVDYSQQMGQTIPWDIAWGTAVMPTNGIMQFTWMNRTGWDDPSESFVAVEDNGDEINVYNFWGFSYVTMKVNEDHTTVSIPNKQPVEPMYLENESDYEIYGNTFYLYGVTDDGHTDDVSENILGNLIYLDIKTGEYHSIKTGEVANGIYVQFLREASLLDSEGAAYGTFARGNIIWYPAGLSITMDPDAIHNVVDNNAASKATFNLAGQRVSNDYKGIVLKNGKKVIKK